MTAAGGGRARAVRRTGSAGEHILSLCFPKALPTATRDDERATHRPSDGRAGTLGDSAVPMRPAGAGSAPPECRGGAKRVVRIGCHAADATLSRPVRVRVVPLASREVLATDARRDGILHPFVPVRTV
jgi:hypothetical protein